MLEDDLLHSQARLLAVEKTGLLDSPSEESFDSMTKLAAKLLKVPVSFISIVDKDRDFYKSEYGFGEPLNSTRQLEGKTFCHFTLSRDEPLVIEDTHSRPEWKTIPTVLTLGVRSYIGVPLQLDGQTIGSFCVVDMQPRVWLADEIEALRQLGISAVREINLRAALRSAEESLRVVKTMAKEREEMLAVVAHDIRTPLHILQLSTSLLQRSIQDEHRVTTARMQTAITAMKIMADSLLSAGTALETLDVGKQKISAGSLVFDAVDMMHPIAERAGITLTLNPFPDAMVTVDYSQMLRSLGNVIGNSLKYSGAGSHVVVSGEREANTICITVTDNGKGMDEDELSKAFERGWQGREGMSVGDGAGLGLSIVKALVTQQGGSVTMQSALGKGTSVSLSLPCE